MSVLNLRWGHLEPTATYSERSWKFVPSDDPAILGTLTIVCDHARRNRVDTTCYSVIPIPARNGRAASVELENVESGEVYEIALDPEPRCNCKAAQCKLQCKHLDAAIAMESDDPGSLIPLQPEVRNSAPTLADAAAECLATKCVVPF